MPTTEKDFQLLKSRISNLPPRSISDYYSWNTHELNLTRKL